MFSIIRKHELKPVLMNNVDERFEVPKVGDEVVMTLMARPMDQILALPKLLAFDSHIRGFPDTKQFELLPYLRIFRGDSQYILEMYQEEKRDIMAAYEERSWCMVMTPVWLLSQLLILIKRLNSGTINCCKML